MQPRLLRVLAVLAFLAVCFSVAAVAVDPSTANSLWVAEQDGVMRLSSARGELLFEIRDIQDVRAVEVDLHHSRVWAYAKRVLSSYDFSGRKQLGVSLPTSDSIQASIAVSPADGTVWLAVGQDIFNVSPEGQVLSSLRLSSNIVELEVDPKARALWVGTGSAVQALDLVSGAPVLSLQLPANATVVGVGPDVLTGRVWVALKDEVRLFGPSGELLLTIAAAGTTQVVSDLAGGAWIATAKSVNHVSASGAVIATAVPFDGTAVIGRLASAGDKTLWVASQDSIAHLSPSGAVLQRLGFQPPARIRDLAVNADAFAPELTIVAPPAGACLADSTPTLQLAFSDIGWGVAPDSVVVSANGTLLAVSCTTSEDRATCELTSPLADGVWSLAVTVQDFAGNRSAVAASNVKVDTAPPSITIDSPADGAVTDQQTIAITGSLSESATLSVNGMAVEVGADRQFVYPATLTEGESSFTFIARDCAGNQGSRTIHVTYRPNRDGLPPDPASVAPPISQATITGFASATSFLYQGPQPIQSGVAPGTIEPARAAVIRGRVIDRDGSPLPGATITVHGHSEFGQTRSRADGMFDLVVNGGGVIVLEYFKDGYIPAQRDVATEWRNYARASDVALVAYDSVSTTVQAGSPTAQVARASSVQDKDGARTATVIFPPDTSAGMVLPDGSQRALSSFVVRATELTVGDNGLAAMPAALPPTTAYTYAVELSIDEAVSSGAVSVTFNHPVFFYVENFLGVPTGGIVPSGFYDRQRAVWVPSDNGRVIAIVGTTPEGLAQVDVDGRGAADEAALASLGFTPSERRELARLYAAGTRLWRIPLSHFTPCDFNWPSRPPLDATPPPDPDDQNPDTDQPDKPEHPDNDHPERPQEHPRCTGGSIIECENQVLGESIPLTGTPYRLSYQSRQSAGFYWDVRLSGASVPASLKRIELFLSIAGRELRQTFPAQPNQTYRFVWDGRDIYGRRVQGRQIATARVSFIYDREVLIPQSILETFGMPPVVQTAIASGRLEMALSKVAHHEMGGWDPRGEQIGGWSLSAQHVYDPNTQILYMGTGEQREVGDVRWTVRTIAGKEDFFHQPHRVDGGPAYTFDFDEVTAVAVASDGSVFVGSSFNRNSAQKAVYRIAPDGTIHRFAGGGTSAADGVQARDAALDGAYDLAVAKDDSLYIMTASAVRKVLPDGRIFTILKNLPNITGIGLSPAGELYISTAGTSVFRDPGIVYQVTPDGKLRQVASSALPTDVAVDADGNVYVCDGFQGFIWRLRPTGEYSIYAGAGFQDPGDGGPASNAYINGCINMSLAPDGSLLFVDLHEAFTTIGGRLRKISPSGIMSTLAGGPRVGARSRISDPEGAPAIGGEYNQFGSLAVAPDGSYIVAENFDRVYRISSRFPSFSEGGSVIPSADGNLLYVFNGPLQEIRSTHTGAVLLRYEYDAQGLLVGIVDAVGNRTRIERDGSGRATAVIAPQGDRTTLGYDSNGMLTYVVAPGERKYAMSYYPGALLRSFKNPRGAESSFSYSATGRLLADQNGVGESKGLTRLVRGPGRYRVVVTSAEGRTVSHGVDQFGGTTTRTTVDAAGLSSVEAVDPTGGVRQTSPDGTVRASTLVADPRWGMNAPINNFFSIRTPSGLALSGASFETVRLSNQDDLLSLQTIDESLSVNSRTTRTLFDASARTFTMTTPQGRRFSAAVDSLMRPTVLSPQGLEPVRLGYDSVGRVASILRGTGSAERRQLFTYDTLGRVKTATDSLDRVIEYNYDAAGRLILQTFPDNRSVSFEYDENGNLTSVGPPGRPVHRFEYDLADRRATYSPPEVGLGPLLTRYGYDHDGNLVSVQRPSGRLLQLHYDLAGRLDAITSDEGTFAHAYAPASGHLQTISTPAGDEVTFGYDGFLPTSEAWNGRIRGSVQRTFDRNFWLASESVAGGAVISFGRDQDGLLSSAGSLQIGRNSAGDVGTTALGVVATQYQYNSFGELTGIATQVAGADLFSLTYERDKTGRVTTMTERSTGTETTFSYEYDVAGRLRKVTRGGIELESFDYDQNGNRSSAVDPWGAVSGEYDAQDRVQRYGNETFTHNREGELDGRTEGQASTQYRYDALSRLKSVVLPDGRTIEYMVDGEGRRIAKSVNGTLVVGWLYRDGVRPIAQVDGNSTVMEQFVYTAPSGPPAYMIKDGATYRFVIDHLGSVRRVVDAATGQVVQQLDYDAFGRVMFDSNPGFQPFGFAGGLYDYMTGLVHFGVREYDPRLGRWMTKDPVLFASRDTNLYSYALADPVNLVDPSGLATAYCGISAGAAPYIAGGVEGALWIDHNGNYGTAEQAGGGVGYQVPGIGIVFGITSATGEEMGGEGGQITIGAGPSVGVTRSGTSNWGGEGGVGLGGVGASALETYTVVQTRGNIWDDATRLWQGAREELQRIYDALFNDDPASQTPWGHQPTDPDKGCHCDL